MRILGIDPGLAIVGFGLIEAETGKTQMLQYGAVTTPAGLPLAARLVQLERDMEELIAQLRPEAIAVEELFFSNNITTGIAVAHARGIILCTAAKSGIPLFASRRRGGRARPGDLPRAQRDLAARARTKSGQANRLRRTLHVLLSRGQGRARRALPRGHRLRRRGLRLPHNEPHHPSAQEG